MASFFKLIPSSSLLITSYKASTIQEKLNLRLPYTNLELIDYLKNYAANNPDSKVFEYGSGSSTLFFEDNYKEVYSIEYDEDWYQTIKKDLKKTNLYLVKPEISKNPKYKSKKFGFRNLDFYKFVNFIKTLETKFDIIFIDGRARLDCLKVAKDYLNPDGAIILDDSHRFRYRKILETESQNKTIINFKGFTTFVPGPHMARLIR